VSSPLAVPVRKESRRQPVMERTSRKRDEAPTWTMQRRASGRKIARAALGSRELATKLSLPHHLSATGVHRVIDNPFRGVHCMIILVAEMPKALRNGLKPWPFCLMIKRVVCVSTIDNPPEQHERGVGRKLVFFQDCFERTLLAVMA